MINFPILSRLAVKHYDLYPGKNGDGLSIEFKPGMSLVLGANGLGKTTLVTMLFRMLTGPYDIKGLDSADRLGGRKLDATPISRQHARYFAARVSDGARDAVASLSFELGEHKIEVHRSLEKLGLISLSYDGVDQEATERSFHSIVQKTAGVSSFGDWVLLLRHTVFYFEDRRALVWDPSAQSEILRFLFLSPRRSASLRAREREIRERDSGMRNLRNILTREESALSEAADLAVDSEALRSKLETLSKLLDIDETRIENLNESLASLDNGRKQARLRALQAEADYESTFRDLERRQLIAIEAAFPSADTTARYLLSHLVSEEECLGCGAAATAAADALRGRVDASQCVVCGSELAEIAADDSALRRGISRAEARLDEASDTLEAARQERHDAELEFSTCLAEIETLSAQMSARRSQVAELIRALPPEEAELHERRGALDSLESRVLAEQAALRELRAEHAQSVERALADVAERKSEIKAAFDSYAAGFLLEECHLVWSPHRAKIGETGTLFDFPSFELEMTGASFSSPVRRSGPDQVSESQREFIDLAFRMALMDVAAERPGGTLIIDAPESSLDAVFVSRAAEVLTRFGKANANNRLVVTSNVVDGDLIPTLLHKARVRSRTSGRIVDLLLHAQPTAATRELATEYDEAMADIFKRAARG